MCVEVVWTPERIEDDWLVKRILRSDVRVVKLRGKPRM